MRLSAGGVIYQWRGGVESPVWWITKDGDLDCLQLYNRHYSAYDYKDGRERKLFVGPGEKLVLRTKAADALFVWRRFIDGSGECGINCAVFRNESPHLSSDLIRQADAIADAVWTCRRHYTYVNSEKVASENPGFCFIKAGWKRCGMTKGGLLVLERVRALPPPPFNGRCAPGIHGQGQTLAARLTRSNEMAEQFTAREERTFVKSLLDQTGATPAIVDRLMDEYDERQLSGPARNLSFAQRQRMRCLCGGDSSTEAESAVSTAPYSETKAPTCPRTSFVKRTRLLMQSGLVAGITPTSIAKRSPQKTLDFALSRRAGSDAE